MIYAFTFSNNSTMSRYVIKQLQRTRPKKETIKKREKERALRTRKSFKMNTSNITNNCVTL